MTTTPKWIQKLEEMQACNEAIKWAEKQPDLATAWKKCERPDWLWWLLKKVRDELASAADQKRMSFEMNWLDEQHGLRFSYYCSSCRTTHQQFAVDSARRSRKQNVERCKFIRYYFPTPGPQQREKMQ